MDARMQGLHAAAEHRRHAGDGGDLGVIDSGFLEDLRGAAARDELDAEAREPGREGLDAGLVVHGKERAHDRRRYRHIWPPSTGK